MSFGPSTTSRRAVAASLLLTLVAPACTGGVDAAAPSSSGSASAPSVSPSLTAPARTFELEVVLRTVRVDGVDDRLRPRDVREPARAVARTMTDLYSIAFVDPSRWQDGGFPSLLPLFAGTAREEAEDHLRALTLGRAARELEAVKPRRATLDVRFLADGGDHPVAAVADMRFEGIGLAGEDRRTIRHDGEYVLRRVNGSWRVVAYDVVGRAIETPQEAAFAPGLPSRGPMFVLVIGSDARPGQPVTATHADSLHIVGVNPRLGRASILGIPRDSWVPIPGAGSDKINAALVRGGPELLVETVERMSGIPMDAYVLTGFQGFEDTVAAIGGIDITIPYPISDSYAHAQLRRGPQHLTAREALAFSRARHDLPNGDFGRSLNQGRVLVAALATLREHLARSGGLLLPWVVAGARYLHTNLSLADMFDLLLAAPAFDPGRVTNQVVTGSTGSLGGRSVVFLDGGANASFRDLGRDGLIG